MILIYLLLGHLVADFILQPFELIKWKAESWKGIAVHSLIHFLTYFAVLFLYISNLKIVLVLLLLTIAHFLIDCLKIEKEKRSKSFIGFYLFDQLLHLITLTGAAYALNDQTISISSNTFFTGIYSSFYLGLGLVLFVLVTFVAEITKYQFLRAKNKNAIFKPDYKAMFKRFLYVSILYGAIMLLVVENVAAKVWTNYLH